MAERKRSYARKDAPATGFGRKLPFTNQATREIDMKLLRMCLARPFLAVLGLAALAALPSPARAQEDIRKERVQFESGATQAVRAGAIRGRETIDYLLGAQAGQRLVVDVLRRGNRFLYFNVLPPGSETALHVGSGAMRPDAWAGVLPAAGDYTVRVYLMPNAARRGESAAFDIAFTILAARPHDALVPGTRFHATATARCSLGKPTLTRECKAGVIRGAIGSAAVYLNKIGGGERILNFHAGKVTSPHAGKLESRKDGDRWVVSIDGREFYAVVEALVNGG